MYAVLLHVAITYTVMLIFCLLFLLLLMQRISEYVGKVLVVTLRYGTTVGYVKSLNTNLTRLSVFGNMLCIPHITCNGNLQVHIFALIMVCST
jgi:hypothetical protein